MVVIISDEDDQSTNRVIDWFNLYQKKFIRINPSDIISEIHIDSNLDCSFKVNGLLIELNKVTSFWYRRGYLNLLTRQIEGNEFIFSTVLNKHLKAENIALGEFILKSLVKKNSLGNYFNTEVNKFDVLQKAKASGLNIPDTIVTSKKKDLNFFIQKHGSVITKNNSEVILETKVDVTLISYTKRIGPNEFDDLDETFSPSLFQNEIDKKYELRIFFIDDKFYPMAIFSQLDNQTAVDFRIYNNAKPNRTVPYNLPNEIIAKLKDLIKACDYNTGSIDMIVTTDNKYFFLEVNPVGQFDMVSLPCNYHLHKKIADKLCFNQD